MVVQIKVNWSGKVHFFCYITSNLWFFKGQKRQAESDKNSGQGNQNQQKRMRTDTYNNGNNKLNGNKNIKCELRVLLPSKVFVNTFLYTYIKAEKSKFKGSSLMFELVLGFSQII